jgi:hypothetical protein
MEDLVDQMTKGDPANRPRIEQVIGRFTSIRGSLHNAKLRSALTSKQSHIIIRSVVQTRQFVRTAGYILSRKAAIPDPHPDQSPAVNTLLP